MKKLQVLLLLALFTTSALAQSPEMMSYQAVVRNSSNQLITNTSVGMKISIIQGSPSGNAAYIETQIPTANANGLVSIEIGGGTLVNGDFNTIDWSNGPYFVKTETDPLGGTSYTITGTSQLLSVPYALHSKTAESITGTITSMETDPMFGASVANGITSLDTAHWNNHTSQLDSTGIAALGFVAGATSSTGTRYLGEEFAGGVIYHLYIGSDGLQHGLIVNKIESLVMWQATLSQTVTGATPSWDGVYNTNLMTGSAAATYVNGLTDGGYTDWYLPSIDELIRLYANRGFANKALNAIGGATLLSNTTSYWSSTEISISNAEFFHFGNGTEGNTNKSNSIGVRAIRAF